MPAEPERKLKATARKKGFGKERTGAYVYGTLAKMEKGSSHNSSHMMPEKTMVKIMRSTTHKHG